MFSSVIHHKYLLVVKLRINVKKYLLTGCLAVAFIFLNGKVRSQTGDSTRAINFPLVHEGLSLYDFAEVRMETGKTEKSPADIIKRNFLPAKEIFEKDEFWLPDSVKSIWIKFGIINGQSNDTTIALVFDGAVSEAILYKAEEGRLIRVGKTGFFYAVLARNVSYRDNRIDLLLKAHSNAKYFVQVILYNGIFLTKMPVLQNFVYAEANAFKYEKGVNRLRLLWAHFFSGIFFMFFVFGLIKYLVVGKDRSYFYFSLMGLFLFLLAFCQAESPPLELPWFERIRGVELQNTLADIVFIIQGLFILEILHLKTSYPRITRVIKWYFFIKLLLILTDKALFFAHNDIFIVGFLDYYVDKILFFLLLISWVVYLATMRTGFYKFIFMGALTILIAFTLMFIFAYFGLGYLLPAWFGGDQRESLYHFMHIAYVADMGFYFTGLAYRDRQMERDKILVQEQLKLQEIESERAKAELRQQATELEMQALRAQMNPHFIFNSLNSINRFILQNNKTQASVYLTKFSKLVRMILQNSQASMITLESELEALKLYLDLESLRFEYHFTYNISVPKDTDIEVLKVPPLIIQPYVENAIWHGLMHKEEKGQLNIDLTQEEHYLVIKILDDGIGRKQAAALKTKSATKHKSVGLKITADRIAMMQDGNGNESAVTINDLVNPDGSAAGTEVIIKIPVLYE